MRHHRVAKKFGRSTAHRKALMKSLVTNLILADSIQTTLPKAKQARKDAEKIVTIARKGTLAARRLASSRLQVPRRACSSGLSCLSRRRKRCRPPERLLKRLPPRPSKAKAKRSANRRPGRNGCAEAHPFRACGQIGLKYGILSATGERTWHNRYTLLLN